MKKFLRLFALMALILTGTMTTEAGKVLTYDFMTNHPSATIRIDQGYKEVRGIHEDGTCWDSIAKIYQRMRNIYLTKIRRKSCTTSSRFSEKV